MTEEITEGSSIVVAPRRRVSRREFLRLAGSAVGSAAVAGVLGSSVGSSVPLGREAIPAQGAGLVPEAALPPEAVEFSLGRVAIKLIETPIGCQYLAQTSSERVGRARSNIEGMGFDEGVRQDFLEANPSLMRVSEIVRAALTEAESLLATRGGKLFWSPGQRFEQESAKALDGVMADLGIGTDTDTVGAIKGLLGNIQSVSGYQETADKMLDASSPEFQAYIAGRHGKDRYDVNGFIYPESGLNANNIQTLKQKIEDKAEETGGPLALSTIVAMAIDFQEGDISTGLYSTAALLKTIGRWDSKYEARIDENLDVATYREIVRWYGKCVKDELNPIAPYSRLAQYYDEDGGVLPPLTRKNEPFASQAELSCINAIGAPYHCFDFVSMLGDLPAGFIMAVGLWRTMASVNQGDIKVAVDAAVLSELPECLKILEEYKTDKG